MFLSQQPQIAHVTGAAADNEAGEVLKKWNRQMSIQSTSHIMPGDKNSHLVGNELLKAEIQTVQSHSKHKVRGELSAPGLHGMSSRRNLLSKRCIRGASSFLRDVLLSGWPVNVSDHTLHHPLNALVHPIPV